MSVKSKKILEIILTVVIILILAFAGFLTVSVAFSGNKGYTPLFGHAYVSVQSGSMEGAKPEGNEDKPDGFLKGDLIRIRILSDSEKSALEEGDVISFYMMIGGALRINTHRITDVGTSADGRRLYTTKGDNPSVGNAVEAVFETDIVGIYTGRKLVGMGRVTDFLHSSEGFFCCVVLPSLAIVAYFAVNLAVTIKRAKNTGARSVSDKEKEAIRLEIMRELMEEQRKKSVSEDREKQSETE